MSRTLHYPWDLIVFVIEVALFSYFIFVNAFYLFTAFVALFRLPDFVKIHRVDPLRSTGSALDKPISIVIPAFNEEVHIERTVNSLLAIEYAASEIVVVNDGSTDGTLAVLTEAFALEPFPAVYRVAVPTKEIHAIYRSATHPNLMVVDKVNGGKGDALNAGVNVARFPLIFSGDADSFYHPSTLIWMSEPFEKNPLTIAVGGAIAVGNDAIPETPDGKIEPQLPKGWLPRFQALEYLRAFLGSRMGWAPINGLGTISGACGLWRRDIIVEAGGYRTDTIWEDLEMTLRAHNMMRKQKRPYNIAFAPYPVCWTSVPSTFGELYRQRKSWHRHLAECMVIHRNLLFGGGVIGWLTMPYLMFAEFLAPAAVLFGLLFAVVALYFHFINIYANLLLLGLVVVLSILISLLSILLDQLSYRTYRSSLWPLLSASVLDFFFRQFIFVANLSGLFAWLFRRPFHGRKGSPPGINVAAYRPEPYRRALPAASIKTAGR